MKAVNENGDASSIQLMKPSINNDGEMEYENDISSAKFDIDVQVGPTSQSRRAATVKALTGMLSITSDPETQQVLQAMAMMNMEGEGISDVRDFFRKKLLKLGVIKPSDEEAQELMIEIQGQPQDPNTIFLQAAAEEAVAKAAQARANTVLTVAKAEETQAKTLETMSKIGGEVTITAQPEMASPSGQTQTQAQPEPMNDNADIERMKMELELEGLRADTAMKIARLAEMESKLSREREDSQMNNVMAESVKSMQEMMDDLNKKMQEFQDSVDGLSKSSKETADKAIEAIKRPKRIIRENGKIVGIETE